MRTCDVAVVGLGLMGSAALDALLNDGVDALGFDPVGPGDSRGSSHGSNLSAVQLRERQLYRP